MMMRRKEKQKSTAFYASFYLFSVGLIYMLFINHMHVKELYLKLLKKISHKLLDPISHTNANDQSENELKNEN
jgi:uncharacterized membrane protein SpoIIM required for sporulation